MEMVPAEVSAEPGEEEQADTPAPAPPTPLQRASSMTLDELLKHHKETHMALQERLKLLNKSLKQFDQKAARAKIETEEIRLKARAEAKKMWKGLLDRSPGSKGRASGAPGGGRGERRLHDLPADVLRRVMERLTGQKVFMVATANSALRDAQVDVGFWEERIALELREGSPPNSLARELKDAYRQRTISWARVLSTFTWLQNNDCPSNVHGTKRGPWSTRTLTVVLADLSHLLKGATTEWRRTAILQYNRVLCALLSNVNENIQEMAASCLANILQSSDGGKASLMNHGALKPLQKIMMGSARGLQKQASRALVNAWIDDAARVVFPCPSELLNFPSRTQVDGVSVGGVALGGVDWLCVEFSPSGEPTAPFPMTFSHTAEGLTGRGEDIFGAFRMNEATVNRSLQWTFGTSVDAHSAGYDEESWEGLGWSGEASRAGGEEGKGGAVHDFPELLQAMGLHDKAPEGESGAAKRDSSGGWERLTSGSASNVKDLPKERRMQVGELMEVISGSDHIELLKTYSSRNGNDHVRYVAFGDSRGLWGFWERGHYYHQHKIENCTRGAFRMWIA